MFGPLLLLILSSTATVGSIQLPDPSEGQIDGKVALLFWPHGPGRKLLPASGCEAHLVPQSDPDQELVYPCGEWFQPPAGRYRAWLEQGDSMTPSPWLTYYAGGDFKHSGQMLIAPVVPAGRVRASSESRIREGQHLRIVHVDSHLFEGGIGRLLDRRVAAHAAYSGARMPAGEILVGVFEGDNALALSRPVRVGAGETVAVSPRPPSKGSDLLVALQRAPGTYREEITALVNTGEDAKKADLLIAGADRIVALWYGLEASSARLRVSSQSSFLREDEISLRAGKVTTYRGALKPRPTLGVTLFAPEDFDQEAYVEIDASGAIQSLPLLINEPTTIENAPAEPLRVTLQTGAWRFTKEIDLSDGIDGSVTFELHPVRVSGVVLQGRNPSVGAEVGFQVEKGEVVSGKTDGEGEYRLTLWREGYYPVLIDLPEVSGPPIFDFVRAADGERIDFRLPDNRYSVRVVDGATKEPIAAASVRVDQRSGNRETSQAVVTDSNGTVVLPPLGEGTLTLVGSADGYRESSPQQFQIPPDAGHLEILLALEREQEDHHLRILLSNGVPASGAEAWILMEGSGFPVWQGKSDQEGVLRYPMVPGDGILLLRHPHGSSVVRRLHSVGADQILPPVSAPLRIRIESRSGEIVRSAAIALILEEARLFGPALAFFTWSAALVDGSSTWIGRNLPPRPMRALAATARQATTLQTGALDWSAVTIAYPWESQITLTVVE
jgi:hypothetical protein